MIICNSADEIMQALESLLKQPDLKMQQAVEHNQKLAHSYINQPQRIAEVITRLVVNLKLEYYSMMAQRQCC